MIINKITEGKKLTMSLKGRLDTATAEEFEQEVATSLEGVEELVLDFEGLDYVSSAGLRVILNAQKIMNTQGRMTLMGVNVTIMEVFEITGFIDVLEIE